MAREPLSAKTPTLAVLVLLLAAVPVLPAAPAQSGAGAGVKLDQAQILEIARQIIRTARYGTLVTLGDDGHPQARIVDPIEPDRAFTVYVATNPLSRKVKEIRKDPRVTLLYFDPVRPAYVTLIGRATEIFGSEKTARHKPSWEAFFLLGQPDTYTLYRIVSSRVEVVSAKDGLAGDPATWKPEIVHLK